MWVLGIEPRSSTRAASALNGRDISSLFSSFMKTSLTSPGWPQTQNVPISASRMLGLQSHATTSGYVMGIYLCVYMEAKRQPWVSPLMSHPDNTPSHTLKWRFSLSCSSPTRLGWLASQPWDHLSKAGISSACHHSCLFFFFLSRQGLIL